MLACAEDLGAVPDCVPRTLGDLGILSLRVLRWARRWAEPGEPYVSTSDYPYLSVCTPAVHDSSTVREWWETEADRYALKSIVGDAANDARYSSVTARAVLKAVAAAASMICVFQLQDLLHLNDRYFAADRSGERVNVPGTINDFNWTYRLPMNIAVFASDSDFTAAVKEIVESRTSHPEPKTKKGRL